MKMLKNIFNWLSMFLGTKNDLTNEAVKNGICDFGGQGRNEFGK